MPEQTPGQIIGQAIRTARCQSRWGRKATLREVADMTGLSIPTLAGYEKGTAMPPAHIFLRLARVLNLDMVGLAETLYGAYLAQRQVSAGPAPDLLQVLGQNTPSAA